MISSHEINRSLYSFRALACLGVFLIHASLPGAVGVIVTVTSRRAVPFFFLTSGYFAYGAEQSRIKLREKKTLHLFVKWLIFYVCINWIVLLQQGKLGLLLKNALDFSNWLYFFACNWVTPFAGCGHLWYVFALLYVYTVFTHIKVGSWVSKIPLLVGAALAFVWCFQTVNVLFGLCINNVIWRNWLFEGIPLFLLGYWIAWKTIEGERLLDWRPFAGLASLAILILFVELLLFRSSAVEVELPISAFVVSFGIFWWSVNNPEWARLSWVGMHLADKVYLIHYSFLMLLWGFTPLTGWLGSYLTALVAIVFSCAVARMWDTISSKRSV